MINKHTVIFTSMLALVSVATMQVNTALAEPRGYVTDSSGEIWRDSAGDCIHGREWTEADATVVGCDGVTADTAARVIVGEGTGAIAGIVIPAGAVFGLNETTLNDDSKAVIDDYRKNLGPELTDAYMVLVIGHTDTSGDASSNKEVSLKRAQSVADYLITSGVKEDSIRVIGRGSEEPLVSNETLDGRKENRRVDILVAAEVRALDTMIFPSAVLFERRNGDLSAEGRDALEKTRMDSSDLLSRASFIEIIGHTDDVGDDSYNRALSEKRADSVRDYLVAKGLDASKVVTTGKGESMPIASNSTTEGRTENRRVEILVLGRLKK